MEKTAPKREGSRAPKGPRLLSGIAFCGNCGAKLQVVGRRAELGFGYGCTARVRGIRSSQDCKPAPSIGIAALDAMTGEWFTGTYGAGDEMKRIYDPGTGHASQIAELEATRDRLRGDRQAGLYDTPEETEWYRAEYKKLSDEITALRGLKERKPGFRNVPTGRTVAQQWEEADDARRREILAEYEVRVVLHPKGHEPRVAFTGITVPRA